MTTKFYLLLALLGISFSTWSQGVGINETGAAPDESAILDVSSTVQGVLVPRMTTMQRNSISSPAIGLLVYDSDLNGFWFYNGAIWTPISSGEQLWSSNGNNVGNTNTGNVGVGTDNPNSKLDVKGSGTDDGVVISVGNSDESHKMALFGGRENDPNPFIFRKAGDPIRFVSDENGWTEHMRLTSNGQLGVGTENPSQSALVEFSSTNQGFLPPRMTASQRNAITNPSIGLTIFNTSSNCLNWWVGTFWYNACLSYDENITNQYASNYVHCNASNPTDIVPVINGVTGKTWMDRNLGANRAATSSTDAQAYGSLFQWGRRADGHQCVNRYSGDGVTTSGTTSTLSNSNTPSHGNFILTNVNPNDWRSPQNNGLWQGVNGLNNPCPSGYRLPTEAELNSERLSWSSNDVSGAFASMLKLPLTGYRFRVDGSFIGVNSSGRFWTSTVSGISAISLLVSSSNSMNTNAKSAGFSVRCIKD